MTKQELTEYCLTFEDSAADAPFEDEHIVVRHKSNRKWFALIFENAGRLCINLKCDPVKAGFWRAAYPAVTPAWHMNKTHWNTVEINAGVSHGDLSEMVSDSFRLTAPKRRGGNHKTAKG